MTTLKEHPGTTKGLPPEGRLAASHRLLHRRVPMIILAFIFIFGGLATFGAHYIGPVLRHRSIAMLEEKFHADVELKDMDVSIYPRLRLKGAGLALRHQGRTDVPPLISIDEFSAEAGLRGIFGRPWTIERIRLKGLKITIPPRTEKKSRDWSKVRDIPVLVHELDSQDASLTTLPKVPGKSPRVFEIHHLVMHEVGLHRPASFAVQLKNALPPGEIDANGRFGPWAPDDPGQTPLGADYTFANADLGVFKGIRGTLSSNGKFGGVLEEISVEGETTTPNFTVNIGGHPVNLKTLFEATVDGTNGNTLLHPVRAQFLHTTIVASGDVVRRPKLNGRTIELDVTVDKGRIEDLMRLAVKKDPPPLTGNVTLHTKFELPPGQGDLTERLNLTGTFGVHQAAFTSSEVSQKIKTLSRKGLGKPKDENAGDDISDLRGHFALDAGTITFRGLNFAVEGAQVQLDGTYRLEDEQLDFHGKLLLQAKLSQTTTGYKSWLLKMVDPFFRKDGQTVIPIKVTGTRDRPSFGLDLHRKKR